MTKLMYSKFLYLVPSTIAIVSSHLPSKVIKFELSSLKKALPGENMCIKWHDDKMHAKSQWTELPYCERYSLISLEGYRLVVCCIVKGKAIIANRLSFLERG